MRKYVIARLKNLLSLKAINVKRIIIAAVIIIAFASLMMINRSPYNSLTYAKMNDWSTVDVRFSVADRNNTTYILHGNFKFEYGKVKLPHLVYDLKKDTIQSLNRQIDDYGNWKFISKKPDSILIEDPKVFFNGRYEVTTGIAKSYPRGHWPDTLWVLLSNDSTHIVLNKLSSAVPTQLYKNWLDNESEGQILDFSTISLEDKR